MTLSWAVVGCGGIADRRTIPEGIVPSPKFKLVAVMDADPARAEAVAAKYGVARHSTEIGDILELVLTAYETAKTGRVVDL